MGAVTTFINCFNKIGDPFNVLVPNLLTDLAT